MARVCEICGKGASVGNVRKLLRGHYNVTAKRRFNPNLQRTTYHGRHVLACVKCIRTETRRAQKETPATQTTTPANEAAKA